MKRLFILKLIIVSCLISCNQKWGKDDKTGNEKFPEITDYQFEKPDQVWELPIILKEISGIALLNDSTILCQQDEKGYLYIFNLVTSKVDKKIKFGFSDDYEDLVILKDKIYVLRSNGWIYEISNLFTKPSIIIHKTGLRYSNNTEGLCYDSISNKLLIACKDSPGVKNAKSTTKAVYSYDLSTQQLSDTPFIVFNRRDFKPSAIAVHPISKNIFLLSASKNKILEMDRNGHIIYENKLKGPLLKQPEGISFTISGDMYISNEGRGGKANILFFRNKNSEKLK